MVEVLVLLSDGNEEEECVGAELAEPEEESEEEAGGDIRGTISCLMRLEDR